MTAHSLFGGEKILTSYQPTDPHGGSIIEENNVFLSQPVCLRLIFIRRSKSDCCLWETESGDVCFFACFPPPFLAGRINSFPFAEKREEHIRVALGNFLPGAAYTTFFPSPYFLDGSAKDEKNPILLPPLIVCIDRSDLSTQTSTCR